MIVEVRNEQKLGFFFAHFRIFKKNTYENL